VVWTDLLQMFAVVAAVLAVVGAIWFSLDGGSATVWQVAKQYGRTQIADLRFSWTDSWCFYSALPLFVLLMLAMSTIDQTVIQRLLAVEKARRCQRGYLVGVVGLALLLAALTYTGVGLFAFYHTNRDGVRPVWVVNLDNQTRQSLTFADRDRLQAELSVDSPREGGDGGSPGSDMAESPANANQPLVAWDTDLRRFETLERMVAQQRILRPNIKLPFEDVDELVDLETDELIVDRLAMKKPDGEIVLHARASRELLPYFVANRLGVGAAGLVLIGILAISMASFDSGIHSLATVILVDFHRRGGIGRERLADYLQKTTDRLTESDELKLARPLTAAVGLLAIFLALAVSQSDGVVWLLGAVTILVAGPLMAVFAVGFVSRSATTVGVLAGLTIGLAVNFLLVFGLAVLAGLILGFVVNVWLVLGHALAQHAGDLASRWRWEPLAWGWVMIVGIVVTWAFSLLLSQFLGRRPAKQQLRGLVLGIGELGERDVLHEAISIPGEAPTDDNPRWRQ
jgi:Na+/proline symporter